MDVTHEFWMAVLMAFGSFILAKIFGKNMKAFLSAVGTWTIIGPLLFIFVTGIFKMESAGADINAVNNIGADTTNSLISYVTLNIPGILISDIAGVFVGAIISAFTGG
jgi:hypothetical protein